MKVKDKVLESLLSGEIVSGSSIAKELDVSRNAVWKAVTSLTQAGYNIECTARGYRLVSSNVLSGVEIKKFTDIPTDIFVYDSVLSTNDIASELAKNGVRGVVVANSQTKGRGRLGREFYSPEDSGVYMSFILDVNLKLTEGQLITAFTAVAVAEAIETISNVSVQIKWVNDLFVGGKKLCGILTEASVGIEGNAFEYVIVGIGINTANSQFPAELSGKCTNVSTENGCDINRNELVARIIDNMSQVDVDIAKRDFIKKYKQRSNVIGRYVLVNGKQKAMVKGITDDCEIILEIEGELCTMNGGEVSILIDEN